MSIKDWLNVNSCWLTNATYIEYPIANTATYIINSALESIELIDVIIKDLVIKFYKLNYQ